MTTQKSWQSDAILQHDFDQYRIFLTVLTGKPKQAVHPKYWAQLPLAQVLGGDCPYT